MKPRSGEEKAGYAVGSHPELLSSSGRLTSHQLLELPKRNHDPYILAYIQEQRAYIKDYISAGLTESNSWHGHHSESHCAPDLCSRVTEEHLDDFDFGTPVLIARISKSGDRNTVSSLDPQKGDKRRNPSGGSLTHVTQQRAEERFHSNNRRETPPRIRGTEKCFHKADTKGQTPKVDSSSKTKRISEILNHEETEKAKRLSERRQRKRVKRDIMKPPPSPEKENSEDHPTKVNRKTGKGSTRKKAQAGFALMHGLFATNVGKNRLTLSPLLQNVGVFKKGKASRVAKIAEIVSKKQDVSSAHFSELKFLGKRARKTSQTSSTQSSPSTSTHPAVSNKKLHSSQDRPLVEGTTQEDSERSEVKSVQREASRKPYNPEESIIWDIEQESNNADTDCGASSDQRQGSILMNFCVDAPDSKAQAKECPLTRDDLATSMKSSGWVPLRQNCTANIDSGDRVSLLSLGPSQSASQIRVPETESWRRNFEYASKYFKQMAAAPTHLFEPPEVHNHASLGEILVPSLHAVDLQASHPPASICHLPENAPENCLTTVEFSCNSMDIDGADNLPTCSTPTGEGQSYVARFDFNLSSCPGLPDTWNIEDLGELNSDLYQGCDVIKDPCYVSGTVLAETYEVNKGTGEFAPETPLDRLSTYPTQLQYDAMQDEFGEEQGVDFQTGEISLDHFDNQEESDIRSEVLYIWSGQSSASRVDHLSEEGSDIYENCFGPSDLDPESDLIMDNFHQGRTLLLGLNQTYREGFQAKLSNRLLNVEAEVAGSLKQNHWLPQRP